VTATFSGARFAASNRVDSQFVTVDDGLLFLLTSAKRSAGVIAEFLNQGVSS